MKRTIALLLCMFMMFGAYASGVKKLEVREDPGFDPDAQLLEVYFFDLYATDSILLVCGGETMLVDCGDTNYGRVYVAPRLRELGIEGIDYAVNTHPHDDHLNGFVSLMDEMPIGVFYTFFPLDATAEQRAFVQAAEKHGLQIIEANDRMDLSFGGLKITLFQDKETKGINASSLVMHVRYGDSAVILMADTEPDPHRRMAEKLGETLKADIIKMPHHGANSVASAAWKLIDPSYAVITNRSCELTQKVHTFLKNNGCPVLYTANGYIECLTDGTRWTIKQYWKW